MLYPTELRTHNFLGKLKYFFSLVKDFHNHYLQEILILFLMEKVFVMKFLKCLLLILGFSAHPTWASDGVLSLGHDAHAVPTAKFWRYSSENGAVSLSVPVGNNLTVRTMSAADVEAVLDLQMNPEVRRLFAGLPSTPEETRARLEKTGLANVVTKPAQAGMVIEHDGHFAGYARLGVADHGTSSPAIMLKPEFWRQGIATALVRSSDLAEAVAEARMIYDGTLRIEGAPDDIRAGFAFMDKPLSRHGAMAHPENASFRILSRQMKRAPVSEDTPVIELPDEDWIKALNDRFTDAAEDPLKKDRLYTVRVGGKEYTMSFVTERFGQPIHALRGHFELTISDHLKATQGMDLPAYVAWRQSLVGEAAAAAAGSSSSSSSSDSAAAAPE